MSNFLNWKNKKKAQKPLKMHAEMASENTLKFR